MKTLSIYEAKTHLSKVIAEAKKGKTIFVGAYGKPEVMITPVPKSKPVVFGALKDKLSFNNSDFVGTDKDIQKMFYGE